MRRLLLTGTALTLALLIEVSGARGQDSPPKPGCPGPEHRQFDFWIGDWNVTVQGNQAGTNDVTLEENGCILHEHWIGSRGSTGQSFNFYDRSIGKWQQFWVDNQGNYLHLTGSYADNRLVLIGTAPGPDGKPQQQRLTFFRNDDGSVRQLWEASADRGRSWQVVFDGLYRKK